MRSILVVDDELVSRKFLARLLDQNGYHVREASDGLEGLAWTRAEHPDLVMIDLLMPGMDGFEFVRRLRAEPAIAATRVIFYSATYLIRDVSLIAKAYGVARVVPKSATPAMILGVVADVLGSLAPVGVPLTHGEFNLEHLRLVTGKLSETFRTVLTGITDLIGPDRASRAEAKAEPAIASTF
jgi:CheY-like chemotaxis protein